MTKAEEKAAAGARKELWEVFRSNECRQNLEHIRGFTEPRFLEKLCQNTDFEVDCWKISADLHRMYEKRYKKLERELEPFLEGTSKEALATEFLTDRMYEISLKQTRVLGSPLRNRYLPHEFRHVVWAEFETLLKGKRGYRKLKEAAYSQLAGFIAGGRLEAIITTTILRFADIRFLSRELSEETTEFLNDLKKAKGENDAARFNKLCDDALYVNLLLHAFIKTAASADLQQKLFYQVEAMMEGIGGEKAAATALELWKAGRNLPAAMREGLLASRIKKFADNMRKKKGVQVDANIAPEIGGQLMQASMWFSDAIVPRINCIRTGGRFELRGSPVPAEAEETSYIR